MIVDFRKQQRKHPPIHIDGTVVERVVSFKFLDVHIMDKLNWSTHTDRVVKKAQHRRCHRKAIKIIKDNNYSPRYHPEGEVSTGASKQGPRD